MWESWGSDGETLQTFATLTTEANPSLALIQDRMPVIIERADWPLCVAWRSGRRCGGATASPSRLPAAHLAGRADGQQRQERWARTARAVQPAGRAAGPGLAPPAPGFR